MNFLKDFDFQVSGLWDEMTRIPPVGKKNDTEREKFLFSSQEYLR